MNRLNQKEYQLQLPHIPPILPFPNLPSLHLPSNTMSNTELDSNSFPIYHGYAMNGSPMISPSFNPQLQIPPFVDVVYPASPLTFNNLQSNHQNVRIYDVNDMNSENSSINTTSSSHSSCFSHCNQPNATSHSNNNARIIDIPRFFKSESPKIATSHHSNATICPKTEDIKESVPIKTKSINTPQHKRSINKKKANKIKKLHVCSKCNKTFKYKSHLERHAASHSTEKPFKCNICSKSFGHQYYLQDHIRYNHVKDGKKDRKHKCNICSKTFRLKINLTNHHRIHTGEKPFKCKNCNKAFTQKGNCDAHYRACIGIKPYECRVCKKTFTRKMYLQQHERTHSGIKPFECDICSKSFAIKSNMVKHKKSRH